MRIQRSINFSAFLSLAWLFVSFHEAPDFGPDGLTGLTPGQRQKLFQEEIVFPKRIGQTAAGKSFIEAALLFNQPAAEAWQLLARTQDQIQYLDHVEKITVISKTPIEDNLEFTTKMAMKTFVYRVIHKFDSKNLSICWSLDPSFANDLKELEGFWRLYPFDQEKTIARYGCSISPGFIVPKFILDALIRKDLRAALAAVKKYVDSGGRWKKGPPWPK